MNSAPVGSDSGANLAGMRRGRGRVLAVLGAVLLPLISGPAMSPASAATWDVQLTASPAARSVLHPDQDLTLNVTIDTSVLLADPGIRVGFVPSRLSTPALLSEWLADDEPASGELLVTHPGAVPRGQTDITITIPALALPLAPDAPWGSYGLSVSLSEAGQSASTHTAFVWYPDPALTPTLLSTIVPLTAPIGDTGMLRSQELLALTTEGGWLDRQLGALEQSGGAVAIDPMIIASIRLLGSSAPAPVTAWFGRLQVLQHPSLPLAWADADTSALTAVGAGAGRVPESLSFAIADSGLVADLTETSGSSGDIVLPTVDELTRWPWTWPGSAWPRAGGTTLDTLSALRSVGVDRVLLSSDDLADSAGRPDVSVDGLDALVIDSGTSAAFTEAVSAQTPEDWNRAMGLFAVRSASATTAGVKSLVIAQNRIDGVPGYRLAMSQSAIAQLPWLLAGPLPVPAADAPSMALSAPMDNSTRNATLSTIVAAEQQVAGYAAALVEPDLLTSEQHARTLGLSAIGWVDHPVEWAEAVAGNLALRDQRMRAVSIDPLSDILFISSESTVGVSVTNAFDHPVEVVVEISPSNNRLLVQGTVTMTVDANSKKTAKVPVRAIANGTARLQVTVHSASGYPPGTLLDQPEWTTITVRAEWERIGFFLVVGAVVLLFGFGIWRNIRRRHRDRTRPDTESAPSDG